MKIYLFNPETGVYLGEDFADEAMMQGVFAMPPGATKIAPPEGGRGHILVFDVAAQCWEVRSRMDYGSTGEKQPGQRGALSCPES